MKGQRVISVGAAGLLGVLLLVVPVRGQVTDPLDLADGDAFVRQVFEAEDEARYEAAAEAYLQLLRALDGALSERERILLAPHLEGLALVLPAPLRARVEAGASPGTGEMLAAWWRSQDPLPATPRNERLEAHLARVAYAHRQYRALGRLDDRGRVYIRLGPPYQQTTIDFNTGDVWRKVLGRSLTLNASDFPPNEFWSYAHVAEPVQYLFVKAGRQGYRIGEVKDLLPAHLGLSPGPSQRGNSQGEALVRLLDEAYRQLALQHPAFALRYQEVADYVDLLDQAEQHRRIEQMEARARAEGRLSDNASALRPTTDVADIGVTTAAPAVFAGSALVRAAAEDHQAALRREETAPRSFFGVYEEAEPLPLAVRHARFLDDDGTTRTEVYWGALLEAFHPSRRGRRRLRRVGFEAPSHYLLETSLVRQSRDYLNRTAHQERHLLPAVEAGAGDVIAPQRYVAQGDTGTYHLAVQWDQYAAALDEGSGHPFAVGPHLKRRLYRADSLTALNNDARRLEMSDLMPLLLPNSSLPATTEALLAEATPFPYAGLAPGTPLALYFEVYHLAFGEDDRTRYTVAYEVMRQEDNDTRTAARTTATGAARAARDDVLLDLSDWAGEGVQYSDTPAAPLVEMHFTDKTATPNTKHGYRVIAVNTAGLESE